MTLPDQPWFINGQPWFNTGAPCWNGSTLRIVVRLKNQQLPTPTDQVVSVRLADQTFGGHLPSIVQVNELSGSAIPRPGRSVDVPFTVELPEGIARQPIFWNVTVGGSGDAPLKGRGWSEMFKPCGYRIGIDDR